MLNELIIGFMIIGYIVLFFGIFLMILSVFNIFRHKSYKLNKHYYPSFSLIVPAHNEEEVIERTIKKFLETDYPLGKKEIIVINDGSKDKTEEIVRKYASRIIDAETKKIKHYKKNEGNNLTLINRSGGGKGKSYALNEGINYSVGEIFLFIDADIQIERNIFNLAAKHFSDKNVGAVAGYVGVKKSKNFLNKFVDFEYVLGQKLLRRGFNVLGVHYIVPGGCALFRRKDVLKVGMYCHDTLAEDTDITWKVMMEARKEIRFDPNIRVIADEPANLESLWNQRVRWARGNIQVTVKHLSKIGKKKYGPGATIFSPFWLVSIILPFGFLLGTTGTTMNIIYGLSNPGIVNYLGIFLALSFYGTLFLGALLNKFKSIVAGIISPGIPVLINFTSILFWKDGIVGLLIFLGVDTYSLAVSLFFGTFFFTGIVGTYISRKVYSKNKKIGEFLQLFIFGFWMFQITVIIHGMVLEILKKENKWIRTIR